MVEYQILVFYLGNEAFGIDISRVRTIQKAPAGLSEWGEVSLVGQPALLIDIRGELGLPATAAKADCCRLIVIDADGLSGAVLADRVAEVMRVSPEQIKAENPYGQAPDGLVKGVVRIKRRRISLLDITGLMTRQAVEDCLPPVEENIPGLF